MRSNSRSWRMRSSFVCVASVISPISSRKIVPLSAVSKRPLRMVMAPVNEPFSWPNSSRLQQRLRQGRAADLHQRMRIALAGPMQRLRHQLLAGAGLAGDEDGGVRAGHLADELEDLEHRLGAAHDPLAVGGALAELQPEGAHLVTHVVVLEHAPQGGQQVVDLERLGDVVVGAVLHGLDGR